MMLKTMFDGNQTSFNIIQHRATSCSIVQHRATSCNMVAKWVQHVGLNNVGSCCINMLDPFGRALRVILNSVTKISYKQCMNWISSKYFPAKSFTWSSGKQRKLRINWPTANSTNPATISPTYTQPITSFLSVGYANNAAYAQLWTR